MRSRQAWWFGVAVVAVGAASVAAWQQPVFRAETDAVKLGVTVGDFTVLEDGREQRITYFARGDQENGAVETHVGLLLDTSGSMGADIDLARKAAVRFLNTIRDAVDM